MKKKIILEKEIKGRKNKQNSGTFLYINSNNSTQHNLSANCVCI